MSKATPFNGLRNAVAALMRMLDGKADKDKVVSSVNGTGPDAEGNVQVQVGVASWNDLQDKPFGEEKVVIEWDGEIEDRAVAYPDDVTNIDEGGVFFVKMSDDYYTPDFIVGCRTIGHSPDGDMEEIHTGERDFTEGDGAWCEGYIPNWVACASKAGATLTIGVIQYTFPEPGLYVFYGDIGVKMYVKYLEKSVVTQLDSKFIPSVGGGGDAPFVVTFSTTDLQTATSDKTFADLKAAIMAEQRIVAKVDAGFTKFYLQLVEFSENSYVAFASTMKGDDSSAAVVAITVDNSDAITLEYKMLPYA